MENAADQTKSSFLRIHVLPGFLIFLIPVFSLWFFAYAERTTDREMFAGLEQSIRAERTLSAAEKEQMLDFYKQVPISRIMASNDPSVSNLQVAFDGANIRYTTFRWGKRIAWFCLATILATFVIVGVSVAFSFRSHAAQYWALRIGWPVLRTSAAIQVVGQAVLAVALSYWVTAILTEHFVPKLILFAGCLAAVAVVALFKAIFAKVPDRCEVAGALVPETEAPSLWQHVREMAAKLQTAPPDRIIVGIDPTFFVTEHPVVLGPEILHGRTLYLSLPMLKVLAIDEADAVLGHELAHFSGEDTLWSRRISPLLGKFGHYLQALSHGLSLPVAHFMFAFWKLYGLSIHRLSREREFRADRVGADLVSADAMKRALVKTTCYCEFRAETEFAILGRERVDEELNLPRQLELGYPAFLSSLSTRERAVDERVPHPFDTHPTLNNRLAHLGFDARQALQDEELPVPAEQTWYHAIATAPALEEKMWARQQEQLQSIHSADLAWRLLPANEEEAAIVRESFPRAVFHKKDGREAVLEFDRLQVPESSEPIAFQDITNAELKDSWMRKILTLTHRRSSDGKSIKTKLQPARYLGAQGDLLMMFEHYYNRHNAAAFRAREGEV